MCMIITKDMAVIRSSYDPITVYKVGRYFNGRVFSYFEKYPYILSEEMVTADFKLSVEYLDSLRRDGFPFEFTVHLNYGFHSFVNLDDAKMFFDNRKGICGDSLALLEFVVPACSDYIKGHYYFDTNTSEMKVVENILSEKLKYTRMVDIHWW